MTFEFLPAPRLPDVLRVAATRHGDGRGWFMEAYRASAFAARGIGPFVQWNHSRSERAHVLRGLHHQLPPAQQGKLVRCTAGRILDVAVDIRRGSPTFAAWHAEELSPNGRMLWVPPGFAHGFCTLEPGSEVLYGVTGAEYEPKAERSVRWDDPDLAIAWPVRSPTLAAKDRDAPRLRDAELPGDR